VEVWRENLARLELKSNFGSQNWSGYSQETDFLGLSKKASTYHLTLNITIGY